MVESIALATVFLALLGIVLFIIVRGVNITINVNHNIPERPAPTYTPMEEPDQEATKAVLDAAQALQAFMLDSDQIDIGGKP